MSPPTIENYRIEDTLGEGGLAIVYRAEQLRPVRRQVALKMIKPGMNSAQVVKRFESERQALALLEHPNIASVFDAGVTTDGQPYFVMEHVAGKPIDEFCDDARLTTRQRLGLFIAVCAAVQHAHLKGLIHRDIKPSNVLVTEQEATPNRQSHRLRDSQSREHRTDRRWPDPLGRRRRHAAVHESGAADRGRHRLTRGRLCTWRVALRVARRRDADRHDRR